MPRGVIRAQGMLVHTDSAKLAKAHSKPHSMSALMPAGSQSGYTKVHLVPQHPYEGFNPPKFASGLKDRMYGVHERVISNTMAVTHPEPYRNYNLRHMVESTVGDAYNLANSGVLQHTVGAAHHDSLIKGTLLGSVKTQPKRYGQVPFGGSKY
jgi:hypothetical protein